MTLSKYIFFDSVNLIEYLTCAVIAVSFNSSTGPSPSATTCFYYQYVFTNYCLHQK